MTKKKGDRIIDAVHLVVEYEKLLELNYRMIDTLETLVILYGPKSEHTAELLSTIQSYELGSMNIQKLIRDYYNAIEGIQ